MSDSPAWTFVYYQPLKGNADNFQENASLLGKLGYFVSNPERMYSNCLLSLEETLELVFRELLFSLNNFLQTLKREL